MTTTFPIQAAGQVYAVEAETLEAAQLAVVRRTGVAVAQQVVIVPGVTLTISEQWVLAAVAAKPGVTAARPSEAPPRGCSRGLSTITRSATWCSIASSRTV